MMIYEEFSPSDALLGDIEAFWRCRLEDGQTVPERHIVPPDAAINLCAWGGGRVASNVAVAGPSDLARVKTAVPGVVYVGARLRPGGPLRIPEAPPLPLAHRGLEEAAMSTGLARWIRDALTHLMNGDPEATSAAFLAWPFGRAEADPMVAAVADRIMSVHGALRIADAASEARVSERTLHRRFTPAIGLTPKVFARARRLRRACVLSIDGRSNLARTSAEAGFADQAHFSREALASFGVRPSEVRRWLRSVRHAFLEPA
jgi:AraC-like DNA-binding protein